METIKNAVIPNIGESIQSKHLNSLAEAFNTRILNACGDAHWRIPYYIFSTWFRKPRLDDGMLYTAESEFFDLYQVVNPESGETWPTNFPQQPEGANLQSNILNRFIFGMNYQEKDNGVWVYEREDVRVYKAQERLKNSSSSFRGLVFPFFTAIGTADGEDQNYTAFGLSAEINSNGYISGNSINPQGNSFGGYYGNNPLITSANGCGSASSTGYQYPKSLATIYKLDGDRSQAFSRDVCNEGIGDVGQPISYSVLSSSNPNAYYVYGINTLNPNSPTIEEFLKNQYHLQQFLSTVYFGREQKNHIHRLLYNYITYFKDFDFDWFFNNQYDYAPEIGTFQSMDLLYDSTTVIPYGQKGLLKSSPKIDGARVGFVLNNLSSSSEEQYIPIFSGDDAKVISISPTAVITRKGLNSNGSKETLTSISGYENVLEYLRNNGFIATGFDNYLDNDLYKSESETINNVSIKNVLFVPIGFTFHSFRVSSGQFSSFTIVVEAFINDNENFITKDFDFSFETTAQEDVRRISDIFIASISKEYQYKIRFKIKNIVLKPSNVSGSISVEPIFLFSYKPKIEDAYALTRVCCYYGKKDAELDNDNHLLKKGKFFSDSLKLTGQVTGIPDIADPHGSSDVELNTNGVYEASRRLSLFTRIINQSNFDSIVNDTTLKFKRYASQSYSGSATKYNGEVKYTGNELQVILPYGKSNSINESGQFVPSMNNMTYYSSNNVTSNPNNDSIDPFIDYKYGFTYYNFSDRNILNRITVDLNNTVVSANESSFKSSKNLELNPTEFYLNFDSIISVGGEVFYYKFEDVNGNKLENPQKIDSSNNITTLTLDSGGKVKIDDLQGGFELFVLNRTPNFAALGNEIPRGNDYYLIDKNKNFIPRYNVSGTLPFSNFQNKSAISLKVYPSSITSAYIKAVYKEDGANPTNLVASASSSDSSYSYTMDFQKLAILCNDIYSAYNQNFIQLDTTDGPTNGELFYSDNSSFTAFNTATFSIVEYNKYLAGNNIVVSFLENATSTDLANYNSPASPTRVTIFYKQSSTILATENYTLNTPITLRSFTGDLANANNIEFNIVVNDYSKKSNNNQKEIIPIYLCGKISDFASDNPLLEGIVRDGGLFLKKTIKEIDTTAQATLRRDLFQDIAPDPDGVTSGFLIINEKYIVLQGSIIHNGETISAPNNFIAKNTQFSSVGSSKVIKDNGIIEVARPESFTNEWCLWMNFLPYSPFDTNVYKEEVYGATNSPFIDRCHINSNPLPRSEENTYLNLGLPRAYLTEAPPSYRYLPLQGVSKYGLAFENIVGNSNFKNKFYASCAAFIPPYKIKRAYIDTSNLNYVYIELDRSIDGSKIKETSSNPSETFRTDYNGLTDWLGRVTKSANFRIGDASLSNDNGVNQAASLTGNGYSGSYYPRFFFLKLIPKPFSDGNAVGDDNDSFLLHEHIKQAELYLEAMREGFTENDLGARGKLSCQNIRGVLTPPDYKYDQLIFNATSTAEYYGNKWPSLLTYSIKFNSFPLRYLDNPKGYGAIPNVLTYAEPYVAIAKSINRLTKFRVPYPFSYQAIQKEYRSEATINANEWSTDTYTRFAGNNPAGSISGPYWANFSSPSQPSAGTLYSTTTLPIRDNDTGALIPVTAFKSYVISSPNNDFNINEGKIQQSNTTVDLKITGLDQDLASIAYYNIYNLLSNASPSLPLTLQTTRIVSKLVGIGTSQIKNIESCGSYYSSGGSKYVLQKIQSTDTSCIFQSSLSLQADRLEIGAPFFGILSQDGCIPDSDATYFNESNFESITSVTASINEPGFMIVEVPTIIDQTN